LVGKRKKEKYTLPSAQRMALGKVIFTDCQTGALGKGFSKTERQTLPSACQLALGKDVFAECRV
jgi:hypothetical protein